EFPEGAPVRKDAPGRTLRLDFCENPADRFGGGQQRADRKNNEAITEFLEPRQRQWRSLAALSPVEEQRHIRESASNLRDFIFVLRSFDKKNARAGFTIGTRSAQGAVEPLYRPRVGSRDDQKIAGAT